MTFTLLEGHVIDQLATVPAESVHVCVTSPPYWGLRDYKLPQQIWRGDATCDHEFRATTVPGGNGDGQSRRRDNNGFIRRGGVQDGFCRCGAWRGSLGLEPTPQLFVDHLVDVFRAVRRVLRDDGVVWLNMGDSYSQDTKWGGSSSNKNELEQGYARPRARGNSGCKPGDLVGVPWLLAFALRDDGWFLRMDDIWWKRSPMPESLDGWRWERHRVKVGRKAASARKPTGWDTSESNHKLRDGNYTENQYEAEWSECPGCDKCRDTDGFVLRYGSWRHTRAHEYVFQLAKSARYFCDAYAVREKTSGTAKPRGHGVNPKSESGVAGVERQNAGFAHAVREIVEFRNPRSVWHLASQPTSDAHFATYPESLIEPLILASTSEKGCCQQCGRPWARMVSKRRLATRPAIESKLNGHSESEFGNRDPGRHIPDVELLGWRATCDCNAGEPIACTVLDPFAGTCTTAIAALKLGCNFIGCELSADYAKIARRRFKRECGLFAQEATA